MGAVFELKCPKCKYRSIWEMWIAHGYRNKHDTYQEIKDGIWGEELQSIDLAEGNRINIEEIMLICEECGNIKVLPSLAYKIPVAEWHFPQNLPVDEAKSEMDRHNREDYTEWKKYPHRCEKCNNLMKQITNPQEEEPIHCPKCRTDLIAKWTGIS